jgi:hypothetical protein
MAPETQGSEQTASPACTSLQSFPRWWSQPARLVPETQQKYPASAPDNIEVSPRTWHLKHKAQNKLRALRVPACSRFLAGGHNQRGLFLKRSRSTEQAHLAAQKSVSERRTCNTRHKTNYEPCLYKLAVVSSLVATTSEACS